MTEGGTLICATEPDWYWFFVTVYTTVYRKGQAAGYGRTITAFTVPKDVWILGQWVEEQGKLRWIDRVLSCFPVLGRVGGLALRGIAGVLKCFLHPRRLGHLV